MTWQYLPYALVLTIVASVTMLLAIYAWRRRATAGGIPFVLLLLAVAEWSLASAAEFAAIEIPIKIWWSKASYAGIVSTAPLWFLFTAGYSQRTQWLTLRRVAWLWVVPIFILGLAMTNEWHRLIWPTITPTSSAPGAMLVYGHGLGFWLHVAYSYSLMLLGTFWLIQATLGSPRLYRQQVRVLLVGAAIPWVGNAFYITGLSPLPGLDITPIAFTLSSLMIAWGIFRFQILDIVPMARDILVENMSDGVLVLDAHNRVVDINLSACRLVGCDAARTIGQAAETALAQWSDLEACCQDTLAAPTATEISSTDGSRWLELRTSPLHDRRGRLTGRLIVIHDITTHKRAEEALRQHAHELEARNTELDAFAHTVAHDLKNPVSVIIGFSSLLETHLEKMVPEEATALLHRITETGYKATNIINALLLLARVRRMDDLDADLFDMAAAVAEARNHLSALIAERQAEIVAPEHWPLVFGYVPWVEEVWVNYLSNALKYGGNPPQIELGYSILDSSPQPDQPQILEPTCEMIRFWVKDHGPGLTPEEQAQLFAPFTRLSSDFAEGHGLGLSIVQRIVEKLGGQVGVDSQLGQGSRFWFTLPGIDDNTLALS